MLPKPSPMNESPVIEVRDLTKVYRVGDIAVAALRGVDLCVGSGAFLAIVGPSRSGKSTLFNILGGLPLPTSGIARINGRDLAQMSNWELTELRKTTVGFVFQKYNLLPTLTAEDNIRIVRHVAGRDLAFEPYFRDVLKMLGIERRLQHKPRALSGGEQQRVAIARAIANGPAILLADEPTGNLDSKNSDIVLKLLAELNKQMGQTILLIMHNPDAAAYAQRTVEMRDGRVVAETQEVL
jgi:putative ABC transport system ATP-binding protein